MAEAERGAYERIATTLLTQVRRDAISRPRYIISRARDAVPRARDSISRSQAYVCAGAQLPSALGSLALALVGATADLSAEVRAGAAGAGGASAGGADLGPISARVAMLLHLHRFCIPDAVAAAADAKRGILSALGSKSPKTYANLLTLASRRGKGAAEWGGADAAPTPQRRAA